MELVDSLRERWTNLWKKLACAGNSERVFAELCAHYTEPQRHYHTLAHIQHCLEELWNAPVHQPAAVEMAIWFHDTIYNPQLPHNEEGSAEWAQRVCEEAGLSSAFGRYVVELILTTKHAMIPRGPEAQLLVDVDLSILGQPASIFQIYETQIRREYSWVPEDAYREGRSRILSSFLARPAIYCTPYFRHRYEQRARENLKRSIIRLNG